MILNDKEYHSSHLKRKNAKLVKQSKILTQLLNAMENPKIVDTKLVIIKHTSTSHKLSRTIMQDEKVSKVGYGKNSNSFLYNEAKKVEFFQTKKKKVKITT